MLEFIMKLDKKMDPKTEDAVSELTTSVQLYRMRKAGVDTRYELSLAWESVLEDAAKVTECGLVSRSCMEQLIANEKNRRPNVEEALEYYNEFEECDWDRLMGVESY